MSKGYKFGQIVGIVVGVLAGSVAVNLLLAPFRTDPPVQQFQPEVQPQIQPQRSVFEQALSMPKS